MEVPMHDRCADDLEDVTWLDMAVAATERAAAAASGFHDMIKKITCQTLPEECLPCTLKHPGTKCY